MRRYPYHYTWTVFWLVLLLLGACNTENNQDISNVDDSEQQREVIYLPQGGSYLHFVYIGSSTCSYCTDETTIKVINEIIETLNQTAEKMEMALWTTGITVDAHPEDGFNHLSATGPYHEIIAGGIYYNLGYMNYIWGEFEGIPITPQILILETQMEMEPAGMIIGNANRKESLLHRLEGADNIQTFLDELKEGSRKGMPELTSFLNL